MKKAYVSNFSGSEEELSGPASGEESNAELDSVSKEGAPARGYIAKSHPASGDEETKPVQTSAESSRRGLAILSDSDDEIDPSSVKNENTQEAVNSETKDLNQSVSDLDFDSDIDIDEELERPLQSKFTEPTSLEEKDILKAAEDDIFGASDEEEPDLSPNARKRKNERDTEGGNILVAPVEKKFRYESDQGEREGTELYIK